MTKQALRISGESAPASLCSIRCGRSVNKRSVHRPFSAARLQPVKAVSDVLLISFHKIASKPRNEKDRDPRMLTTQLAFEDHLLFVECPLSGHCALSPPDEERRVGVQIKCRQEI